MRWYELLGISIVGGFISSALASRITEADALVPRWPMIKARNNGKYQHVSSFIKPEQVSDIAASLWNGNEEQFVEDALQWVHSNIKYKSDTGEYWQFPNETLADGRTGDCEDQAVLLSSIALNFIPDFYVGLGIAGSYGHAWCIWDDHYHLDPTSGTIRGQSYDLLYYFNGEVAERV